MNHHKNIVKEQIQNFASALNSGNTQNILSFYSKDAEFMPEGFKTLKKNKIGKSGKFLTGKDFKIQFGEVKITVDNNFAFVEAIAETSENGGENTSQLEKTSRDFFVLRQEENQWKIFRYLFNNVQITKD